ncbi:xylulokinase [Nakamurella deserti]|uniref:xylulokinase n=1 Tax=Nakamurella deserti TaxID=2164074 RepID=UPI001F0C15CB|nr:FGGY-family carbohydrate kinase [Nakamurella deserti]
MPRGDLVIGVDCSTTAAKAVVWNAHGVALSEARSGFELAHPRPTWAEQNPEDWWTATRIAIRRAVQTVDRERIAAICITHQRETFACLDRTGQPLRPAMIWADTRATEEVQKYGTPEVHTVTGKPPNPTPAWYKLLWLAAHEPETLSHTASVVDVGGFLVNRLTGEFRTSWASADPLGVVDLRTFDYAEDLLTAAGLHRDQFADLAAPGDVVGAVTEAAARETGLPPGLPVVAGVGDGQSAQLGCGITAPGTAYLNLGTGIVSGTFSRTYASDVRFRTLAAGLPGGYTLETFIGGGTYNIRWFVEKFAGVNTQMLGLDLSPEQVLEAAAEMLPPGSEGLVALPYWTGALTPYWDHHARGALIGLTGVHGKSHVYRAILESLAFEQRFLTTGAEDALGEQVSRIVALGGGSRSRIWCQILADVMQRRVEVVKEPESTCLGSGVLAAAAVGIHPSIEQAAHEMTGTARVFEPGDTDVAAYDRLYAVYTTIYPALRELFGAMAEAR